MEDPRSQMDTREVPPEGASEPAPQESAARRVTAIARVGARYGFGFVFRRRFSPKRTVDLNLVGSRLRRSFEELGPTYAELGRYLSRRRDSIPPDIVSELEMSSARIPPTPFAEVRRLVERELHNELPRLFEGFEKTPTRVGVFTQSHRATLPGGRNALVVLRRQGVRRDLIAMRPVAELVGRRLGGTLPVNPSEVVSDFVAGANHRRDMYFAAQTIRRLTDNPDFGLKMPRIYRDYSASRCITLEMPDGSPPDAGERARISDEVIRLALVEGVFFADLSPERFGVDAEGRLWMRDPTEVFSLDPERMRGLAEVFAAVRREDVEGVVRSLHLAGGSAPREAPALRRDLRETLGTLGGPLWKEHTLKEIRDKSLEAFRRGGATVQPDISRMLGALVEAAEFHGGPVHGGPVHGGPVHGGPGIPSAERAAGREQRPTVAAVEAADSLVRKFRDPAYVAARTARKLARPDIYADYPRQVHALLAELKDGEIEVRFRHGGLDALISKVDILANRLVFAFLIAALIVGSSMLGVFVEQGVQILGFSIFGLGGFVFAAVLGTLLLVDIIRSGRL